MTMRIEPQSQNVQRILTVRHYFTSAVRKNSSHMKDAELILKTQVRDIMNKNIQYRCHLVRREL